MTTLLDASALLALINEEPGAEKVEKVLEDSAISTVNAAEVATKLAERKWTADQIAPLFGHLQMEILPFDLDMAVTAGTLRSLTQKLGLSLGDRACLATGLAKGTDILTADRAWTKLKIRGLTIKSIR